jgi:tripartite-type tricarboxylate transporter receptor subunit TctC
VPTLAEAGVPGQESLFFQGVVAPVGTPKEIVDQLYREIAKILVRPEVKERLAAIGFGVSISSPEEFQAQIKSEMARWAKVIRDANIKRIE